MRYNNDMQLIVHKDSKRILSFTPQSTFQMPSNITVVNMAGVQLLPPSEWELVTWNGDTPRGFTAQTCYLFMLNADQSITEINKPAFLEQVVI
jgi:hypothetical protein